MLGDSTTIPAQTIEDISLPHAPRRTVPPSLASRYDDVTFVGEGGMGSVYRGRDPRLGRTVALKLIKSDDPKLWLRFIQEAKSQARIQHACVCPVYEAGQADGEPYIAMQYIDGEPLSRLKDKLTLEQRIKLVIDVAMAVHEAHRLGLIHRDIKPGNILVETQEDGSLKPYIMDFGLARQVEEKGQTVTGAIIGTIAYMPPEQANGDIHAMDRRSDVYSLGATLYDVLAGRPPFVAETHWKLILKVGSDEAPRLGAVKPGVPVDLDIIVMKCLERSPSRRYESAKALAEDLQRFLDGEPILAKRSAWTYVFWKKARKHKVLVSLALVAIMASAVPLGAWIHSRKQMAVQMELSRTLGEDVKSMELYLRAAYAMPLHDVEKERDVVRGRLADIDKRMIAAGAAGEGPGHYAIGRGHLALGEIEKARVHLEQAQAAGYASPELHYALGRVLGELYRQGLEESKRIPEGERRKTKLHEIESQLRDPALGHLRAASTSTESPAYVEGLIAFYEGKHEDALAKARQAFAESSMMYEAKKLEADVLYAQGSKYRHDAAFDYGKMKSYFDPAAEAYAAATNIARSDPEVHLAECELWTQYMLSDIANGNAPKDRFANADTTCLRAIEASSKDGRARIQRAFAYGILGHEQGEGSAMGAEAAQQIANAIRLAEEARRASPKIAMAHYVVGTAYCSDVVYHLYQLRDVKPALLGAIEGYTAAIRFDPQFSWARMELAAAWGNKITSDSWQGIAPIPAMLQGLEIVTQGMTLDPDASFTWITKGMLYAEAARALAENGQSPKEQIQNALQAYSEFTRISPNHWIGHNNITVVYTILANYDSFAGADASASLEHAREAIDQAKKCGGGASQLADTIGEFHLTEASDLLQKDRDPTNAILASRDAYRTATKGAPWNVLYLMRQTQVEIVALRWAMKQRRANDAMFDTAFGILQPFLSDELADPSVYVTYAEVHALRAAWLAESKKDPTSDIEKGLALADKALVLNPHKGQALALKGQLLLIKARVLRDAPGQTAAASAAKDAFERAFKENPLLEREYDDELRTAKTLL